MSLFLLLSNLVVTDKMCPVHLCSILIVLSSSLRSYYAYIYRPIFSFCVCFIDDVDLSSPDSVLLLALSFLHILYWRLLLLALISLTLSFSDWAFFRDWLDAFVVSITTLTSVAFKPMVFSAG